MEMPLYSPPGAGGLVGPGVGPGSSEVTGVSVTSGGVVSEGSSVSPGSSVLPVLPERSPDMGAALPAPDAAGLVSVMETVAVPCVDIVAGDTDMETCCELAALAGITGITANTIAKVIMNGRAFL